MTQSIQQFNEQGPVSLAITALGGLGDGVGRLASGQVVFVAGLLPGDEALVTVVGQRHGVARGQLQRLLTPSPQRSQPECPAFGVCGGCSLQHLSLAGQLEHKRAQLQRIVGTSVQVQATAIDPHGHRRRTRMHLRRGVDGLQVGFLASKSDSIAATAHCLALDPELDALRRRCAQVLGPWLQVGEIAAIVGKEGITAHLSAKTNTPPPAAAELAQQLGVVGLRYSIGHHRDHWGLMDVALPEIEAPWTVRTAADGFCQASAAANSALRATIAQVLDSAGPHETAQEFFAGAGNFTDLLLQRYGHVRAVERDPYACTRLSQSAAAAGWAQRLHVVQSEVAAALTPPHGQQLWLLDPGRLGAPEVAAAAAKWRPHAVVYVSCALDTLGRDCATLVKAGYRPVAAAVVDAFPWTVHTETVTLFTQ